MTSNVSQDPQTHVIVLGPTGRRRNALVTLLKTMVTGAHVEGLDFQSHPSLKTQEVGPTIIVIDSTSEGIENSSITMQIREDLPDGKILLLTSYSKPLDIFAVFSDAVLQEGFSTEELSGVISALLAAARRTGEQAARFAPGGS
jgi:DNA-binding NarL/FixJ family response regulator